MMGPRAKALTPMPQSLYLTVDPHLVRRVIKRQKRIGIGGAIPHDHCCVIERDALFQMVSESELGARRATSDVPPHVVLVSRPQEEDPRTVWRRSFHGHVHLHLEELVRQGRLTEAIVRARVHRIGQTEFDEIRTVLREAQLLAPGSDEREVYIEFAAFYLELTTFDPEAIGHYFPTLRDLTLVDSQIALDIDDEPLIKASRPEGEVDLQPRSRRLLTTAPPPKLRRRRPLSSETASMREAHIREAKKRGNIVRSLLVRMTAGDSPADDIDSLAHRLDHALDAQGMDEHIEPEPTLEQWREAITVLADAAARSDSLRVVEARVLHDLQKVCVEAERERRSVDVMTSVLSFGRRPVVRPLPRTRSVRIARHLKHAFEAFHAAKMSKESRGKLENVFHLATTRARANIRRELKPVLESVLTMVGLAPTSVPERVAREKLCAEILDLIYERGSFSLSQLRDALSRSSLKLPNVKLGELLGGDPILRADSLLSRRLDGIYKRGEVYLRGLQAASSVAFGTKTGRALTLHLVVPALASFVVLEGISHAVNPILKLTRPRRDVGVVVGTVDSTHAEVAHATKAQVRRDHHDSGHVRLLNPPSFIMLAVFAYALVHSANTRRLSLAAAHAIGRVLHAVVIGIPRAVLRSKPIRALLRTRVTAILTKTFVVCAPLYLTGRFAFHLEPHFALLSSTLLFVALALFLGTPIGTRFEEILGDTVLRRLRALSRHVLPGLFALVMWLFKTLVEQVDRLIYTVDEWLTFKEGQSKVALVAKGALGIVWFFLTYLTRLYLNVLVEPQVNPIKHFPVVTVSHKIILPLSPTLLGIFRAPLKPFGMVISNTIAGATVFLLPGMFGFLVWELKENWNLYEQNRSQRLEPLRIGHHGETMHALLVPGFHAGTVPKLYAKMRDAMNRGRAKANKYREALREVEHAVETFIDRDVAGLLRFAKRWDAGELEVHAVEVGSNRLRVGIVCRHPDRPDPPRLSVKDDIDSDIAWIHFEEQSGYLIASIATLGFIARLSPEDTRTLEAAFAGLYKRAGVDIVREQVEALIEPGAPYDIADEGLVTWPGDGYRTEVVYPLEGDAAFLPIVRGENPSTPPRALDGERLLFARQDVNWSTWLEAWGAATTTEAPRVIKGPSLVRVAPPRASAEGAGASSTRTEIAEVV